MPARFRFAPSRCGLSPYKVFTTCLLSSKLEKASSESFARLNWFHIVSNWGEVGLPGVSVCAPFPATGFTVMTGRYYKQYTRIFTGYGVSQYILNSLHTAWCVYYQPPILVCINYILTSTGLSLTLFMLWILADNANTSFSLDNFAFFANWFY